MNIKKVIQQELPFFFAAPAVVWQVLFLYIPLLVVFVTSFFQEWSLHNLFSLITLHNYKAVCDWVHLKIIVRSLGLACTNATICLLCAYPVAYYIAFHVKRWRNFFLFLLTIPFWTNFLVHVYAWLYLVEYSGLINTFLLNMHIISVPLKIMNTMKAVYIVMLYCYFPFMIMPLYSILERIDPRLIESSCDLGATPWKTFLRVTFPLSLPGIKTGFFLVFVPSFGEFAIPALLDGSRNMFVGTLISHYFLVAQDPFTGAAFTFVSALFLIAAIVIIRGAMDRAGLYMNRW